ncbi:MAG: hypothetical protein KAG28_03520 [Cocleimonas sp.]|nr:hypothetical protein [Cocleimonas sp.]
MKYNVLLLLLSLTLPLQATAYTITTGETSGAYFKVGTNLASLVKGGKVLESKGSVENLDRLVSGEADIAMVQLDAYAWYLSKYPKASTKIEVMGSLFKECIHIAVNKNGKVQDEDDLQDVGATIAIGKKGSGTAVSWQYMVKLEPGYKKSTVSFTGGSRALGKLALSLKNEKPSIDAVMWVARPNLNNKYLNIVRQNPDLKMIEVDDKDLNDTYSPLGRPIYTFQNLATKDGFFSKGKIEVPCVEAAIVVRSGADEAVLESVANTLLSHKAALIK